MVGKRVLVLAAMAAVVTIGLSGCQSAATGGAASGELTATDDGTTITMWARSSTADITQSLVDAYNASHENRVDLTIVPQETYLQKVGTAAGSQQLPDILGGDVVFTPNYIDQNLLLDLTAGVDALPFADTLSPGQMEAVTVEGKKYAVPHTIDLSAVFYNKILFEDAGLDPEAPPTTLEGWMDAARTINTLGDGVNGFYFGGACGGCMLFTTWPSIWADGGSVLNEDGTVATLDTSDALDVYSMYRNLWNDGIVPAGAQTENGATFTGPFSTGKIGIQFLGSGSYSSITQGPELEIGIAPIPGIEGSSASFVGGDTLSIAASTEHADAAWDFVSWTLSDEAQVEAVAKIGALPVRSDLADNKYSSADPNVVTLISLLDVGQTPRALAFGETFNDANGPWSTYLYDQIFGDGSNAEEDNAAITSSLESGN